MLGGIVAAGFGGCAQNPQQLVATHHPKEYFPASIYGPASRRVIEDGQPIPRGGGQYLVGKPYTVAGQTYYPSERKITQVGYASWYGDAFHGRLTANGEIYDRDGLTAAHPTMPLPSYARVTNLRNNYSMIVRVNDRGPYASNRIMDVSRRVAEALEFQRGGTARIKVEYVGRASLAGSDDAKLYATLRKDGPANPAGLEGSTMVAEAPRRTHVASLAADATTGSLRPTRLVEDQRPSVLAAYRVPHESERPRKLEPSRDALRRDRVRVDDWTRGQRATHAAPMSFAAAQKLATHASARAHERRDASGETAHLASAARARVGADRGRDFAFREMAHPPIPPHRVAVAMPATAARRGLRAGVDLAPPPRPVRFAAIASTSSHGLHSVHSRAE